MCLTDLWADGYLSDEQYYELYDRQTRAIYDLFDDLTSDAFEGMDPYGREADAYEAFEIAFCG